MQNEKSKLNEKATLIKHNDVSGLKSQCAEKLLHLKLFLRNKKCYKVLGMDVMEEDVLSNKQLAFVKILPTMTPFKMSEVFVF